MKIHFILLSLVLAAPKTAFSASDTFVRTTYAGGDKECTKNGKVMDCSLFSSSTHGGSCSTTTSSAQGSGANSFVSARTVDTCTVNSAAVPQNTPATLPGAGGAANGGANGGAAGGAGGAGNPLANPDGVDASENWVASKYNDKEILKEELEKESRPNQRDSFTLQSNIMYGCVDKSLNGRSDSVCASEPDHPECVGLSKSLGYATSCIEMFVPASLGCKVYGAKGYDMEEWIGFGGQYFNSLKTCAGTKASSDALVPKMVNMEQLQMVGFSANGPLGAGVTNYKPEILSGISEEKKAQDNSSQSTLQLQDIEKLIKENPDGAGYLGYDEGELIRRAVKGEEYVQVILDSPFAEKLDKKIKEKAEAAANDPTATAQSALAKRSIEPGALGANNDEIKTRGNGLSPNAVSATSPAYAANSGNTVAFTQNLVAQSPTNSVSPSMEQEMKAALSNEGKNKRPLLSERIAALERMAKNASGLKGRGLASLSDVKEEIPDAGDSSSLFDRISVVYRKKALGMRSDESLTGKAVRSMDQPAFFKEL